MFIDVTEGSNRCGPLPCEQSMGGFSAAVGWDAVTGLGSLRLDKLLAALDARGI